MSDESNLLPGYYMPPVESIENLSEIKSRSGKRNLIDSISILYEADFTVVLAEPGNGKSRLLKELVLQSNLNYHQGFFLDLKKVGKSQVTEVVRKSLEKKKTLPKTQAEVAKERDYFYTDYFGLNVKNSLLCLDALDEVPNEVVFDLIEQIIDLKKENESLKIIISCRDYIYNRYSTIFSTVNPKIVYVRPFTRYLIKVYLADYGFSEKDVETVINHFFRNFNLEIITSPRILEIFAGLAKKMSINEVLELSKAQLIEEFIYGKLKTEASKQNKNEIFLIKRVLEKIALVMEIYQSNMIKKDDLLTFFDNVESNLSDVFFQQIVLDDFLTRSFLISSPDGDSIQFENAEFQEYLAAKEICRIGRTDQVLFDLAIEERLRELLPSWSNTIKYLFELKPELQFHLIDFVCKRNSANSSDFLERVLIVEEKYLTVIATKEKAATFTKVFDLFQRNNWIIRYTLAPRIARYFVEENKSSIDRYLTTRNEVQKANAVVILNHVIYQERTVISKFYKNKLIGIIKAKGTIKWLKGTCASTLAYIGDIEIMKQVSPYFDIRNSDQARDFLRACSKANPNDPFTIDLYIEHLKRGASNSFPTPVIRELNSVEGITYFLKKVREDDDFEVMFRNHSPDDYSLDPFIENLKEVYNSEIQGLLRGIILDSAKHYITNKFHKKLIEVLREKDEQFLSVAIDFAKQGNGYIRNWFIYNKLFVELLSENNVSDFIGKMNMDENHTQVLMNLFYELINRNDERSDRVLRVAEKILRKEFSQLKSQIVANTDGRLDEEKRIYNEYIQLMEPQPGKYNEGVFRYYVDHRDTLRKLVTSKDDERMIKLLEGTVLKFDFKSAKLRITETSVDNSRSFKYSRSIPVFESAIPLFSEFLRDSKKYRFKLIEFLPYPFHNDKSGILFKEIGKLSEKEQEDFVAFYNTPRKDDLMLINIGTFLETCKQFKVTKAISLIQKIVEDRRYRYYERIEALKVIGHLGDEIEFFKEVFNKYFNSAFKEEHELALLSNEILIFSQSNSRIEAIKWRFSEILKKPIETDDANSSGSIFTIDMEYKTGSLLQPLKAVSDPDLIELYLDFLTKTVTLYKKNKKYRLYAAYAWNIVFVYFTNLKVFRLYQPIERLESEIRMIPKFGGYNQLLNEMKNTQLEYLKELGKPSEFSECVKKYNSIKDKIYNNVQNARDFYFILNDIIENDIRKWVEQEGGYSLIKKLNRTEDVIQKTLKTQLENGLMRRGFRHNEVRIRREEQLLDDKRTDFVISYGFIGQVLIELKLTTNIEVTRKDYKKKLTQYIEGTSSDYGIFLIFQVDSSKSWEKLRLNVEKIYADVSSRIRIIGLDCTKQK